MLFGCYLAAACLRDAGDLQHHQLASAALEQVDVHREGEGEADLPYVVGMHLKNGKHGEHGEC